MGRQLPGRRSTRRIARDSLKTPTIPPVTPPAISSRKRTRTMRIAREIQLKITRILPKIR